ncbi:MAG: peptidoglycan-associated lipoprotein Pal [Rhodoferax sp.]|nr:peptidoglycan-associated lipoprotein Pal [Rhodoferax sp.]
MKRMFVLGLVALLAACSAPVKLENKVPVEEKTGAVAPPAPPAPSPSPPAKSAVVVVEEKKAPVVSAEVPKPTSEPAMPATTRLVYFDFDSFAIRPEFQSVIEEHAKYLRAVKNRKVVIEGHTDERGGREYNLALGQKRSEAVRQALVLLGVADGQLEAVSFGKEKPAVPGSTEAAMEKNRRAEISYR